MNAPNKSTTLAECAALAERMAQNPAEAVHQMRTLAKLIHELPPYESQILSRPEWNASSLWTNTAVFQNIGADDPPETEIVRCQRDVWIRGVTATAIPVIPGIDPEDPDWITALLAIRELCAHTSNLRNLFEFRIRLDGDRGFFSTGQSGETNIRAASAAGDGERLVKMDWRLETNQHIEVTMRNAFNSFQRLTEPLDIEIRLALVTISFWGEEIGGLRPGVGRWSGGLMG